MARKITTGEVGGAVGGLNVTNTVLSAADDLDIEIRPSGTGIFRIDSDAQIESQGDLRFADADSSNYVAFQSPATVASNVTWTLPNADGTSTQVLSTNGSGTLSWATPGVTISDNTSDSTTHYPTITTATTGLISAARVTSTKLSFQPSTGDLTVGGVVRSLTTENVQTGNYTMALTDQDIAVTMNNGAAATVTIPADASVNFPVGSTIMIHRINTGTVLLAPAGGVTLTRSGNRTGSAYLERNETVVCRKRGANSWTVYGMPERYLTSTGGNTRTVVSNDQTVRFTSGSSNFVVTAP